MELGEPIHSSNCHIKGVDFIAHPPIYEFPYLYLIKAFICFTFSYVLEVACILLMVAVRIESI